MLLYYQNVRGVNTKALDIRRNIEACPYDVIALCETWMQPGFHTSELFPPFTDNQRNFIVYRNDRNLVLTGKQTGGGVLVGVRANIPSRRMFEFESPDLEMVWVRMQLDVTVYVCCIYLPDRKITSAYHRFFKSLSDNIAAIPDMDSNILIVGDLNLASINWIRQAGGIFEPNDYLRDDPGDVNAAFVHTLTCFELTQFNGLSNAYGRHLDLVLSDFESSKIRCQGPRMILSDKVDAHHPPIEIKLHVTKPTYLAPNEPRRLAYRLANYDDVIAELNSTNWTDELVGDVDSMTARFYQIIKDVNARNIPQKNRPGRYPVWFSCSLIHMLDRKRQLHKDFKRTGDATIFNEFRKLRTAVKLKVTRCHRKYLLSVEDGMTSHIKEFWKYTKSLRKTNTYPTEMCYILPGSGLISADNSEGIAQLFQLFFSSVFRVCSQPFIQQLPKTASVLSDVRVTEEEIMKVIERLDDDKGPGSDGIPSHFVKMAAPALTLPLMMIFNASLAAGVFPILFKSTLIHPVFKAGALNDVSNYRPISIINCFAKLLERIVHQKILAHVSNHLDPSQHGFLPKKSTVSNLFEYVSFLSEQLEAKEQVDMIYIDLSKAFDTISHDHLICKLEVFGINGNLQRWIATYLLERPNMVVFNGAQSDRFFPTSGVPQGSILGPLLFVLYADDLAAKLSSYKSMFADDTKFGRVVNTEADCRQLEADLHEAEKWCTENSLSSNPAKTYVISVTNKNNPVVYSYTSSTGVPVTRTPVVKDLGVHIDGTLKFDAHVEAMVNKAFKSLGFLIRTCRHFMQLKTVHHLYRTLVSPSLDYASPIWSPYYNKYIDSLESVQRRYTRYVYRKFGWQYADYETRCKQLKLLTLRRRRVLHDQMLLFDVVRGKKLVDSRHVSISLRAESSTRNHDRFVERTWRLRSTYSAPLPRMIRHYNRFFFVVDIMTESRASYRSKISGILMSMHVTPE